MAIRIAAFVTLGTSVLAEQLMERGSFELPPVTRRKARAEGADLSKFVGGWVRFSDKPDADGGRLVMGLTNEISRTGRQSLFVQFDKLTKPQVVAVLASEMIPVKPGMPYHVGIWGRVDKANPLTLDQRVPYLKLRIDWFTAPGREPDADSPADEAKPAAAVPDLTPAAGVPSDEEDLLPKIHAQTGEPVWRVQPLPGSKSRAPLFRSGQWSEFFVNVKSPADAAFIKVTWSWESPVEAGETNGVMFFDDASVEGEPGQQDDPLADEPEAVPPSPTPAVDPAKPPGAPDAPPPTPVPSPAPVPIQGGPRKGGR